MNKITIPQHKDFPKHLFDISCFLEDIDQYFDISEWAICIDWCTGENSVHIEDLTKNGYVLGNTEFRDLYRGITQTIDGEFSLKEDGIVLASLLVVDSSYWLIKSKNESFLAHMKEKYGEFDPDWK